MINASCHNLFTYCEPQCLSPSVKTQRRTQFSSGSHYRTTSEATSKRALNCRKSQRRPPIRVLQPFLQKHNRSIAQSLSHWLFNRRLRLLGHKKSDGDGLNRRVLLSQLEQCLGLRSGEACQQRMHLRLLLGKLLVSSRQPKGRRQLPNEPCVLGHHPFNWLDQTPSTRIQWKFRIVKRNSFLSAM